jgi:hypothetical protein
MFKLFASALVALVAFAAPSAFAQDEGLKWDLTSRPTLAVQLPGMSYHFQDPEATDRKWNETHLGIGIEWRSKWNDNDWVFKKSLGLMRDSVESWGAHGGLVWQKEFLPDSTTWSAALGPGLFAFYRALHFDGKREWLPAILPVLSLEHRPSGFGLNVLYVPHFKTRDGEMPAVLFAQFTKRF